LRFRSPQRRKHFSRKKAQTQTQKCLSGHRLIFVSDPFCVFCGLNSVSFSVIRVPLSNLNSRHWLQPGLRIGREPGWSPAFPGRSRFDPTSYSSVPPWPIPPYPIDRDRDGNSQLSFDFHHTPSTPCRPEMRSHRIAETLRRFPPFSMLPEESVHRLAPDSGAALNTRTERLGGETRTDSSGSIEKGGKRGVFPRCGGNRISGRHGVEGCVVEVKGQWEFPSRSPIDRIGRDWPRRHGGIRGRIEPRSSWERRAPARLSADSEAGLEPVAGI